MESNRFDSIHRRVQNFLLNGMAPGDMRPGTEDNWPENER